MCSERPLIDSEVFPGVMHIGAINSVALSQPAAPSYPDTLKLSIETLYGAKFSIRAKLSDTVATIKAKIFESVRICMR